MAQIPVNFTFHSGVKRQLFRNVRLSGSWNAAGQFSNQWTEAPMVDSQDETGCDAFAVREIGFREANDAEIWRYAVQQQAAIITKDEDFAERCLYSRDQPVIVWLRIGNTSNQALLRWFVPLWPEIMRRIELGDRLIEVS